MIVKHPCFRCNSHCKLYHNVSFTLSIYSELRKSALKQVGKDLAIGSHMTLDVSGAKMAVFCFLPSTEEDAWDVEDTFPVKLRPGGALSDRYLLTCITYHYSLIY